MINNKCWIKLVNYLSMLHDVQTTSCVYMEIEYRVIYLWWSLFANEKSANYLHSNSIIDIRKDHEYALKCKIFHRKIHFRVNVDKSNRHRCYIWQFFRTIFKNSQKITCGRVLFSDVLGQTRGFIKKKKFL